MSERLRAAGTTMTAGELRDALGHLPENAPVVIGTRDSWGEVRGKRLAVVDAGGHDVVLEVSE